MEVFLRVTAQALWLVWLVYWIVAARDVKATRWRESRQSRLLYALPMLVAALLFAVSRWPAMLIRRVLPNTVPVQAAGTLLIAAGLAFAAWARRHLGRNWSGRVTVKQDHALVRTGPYRYVRHPIYTGILLAFLGTAITVGEWRGVLAVIAACAGLVRKLTVEERRMRETFPDYDGYRQQTAALIPFVF